MASSARRSSGSTAPTERTTDDERSSAFDGGASEVGNGRTTRQKESELEAAVGRSEAFVVE
jgi:hypothetical protein